MKLRAFILPLLLSGVTVAALAQQNGNGDNAAPALSWVSSVPQPSFGLPDAPARLPMMSPELALQTYQGKAARQLTALGTSSDMTVVEANLPNTGQKGRFELRRNFLAPKSLVYGAIKFVGDTFVKTNIIVKLLNSEVDHVEKGEGASTAITSENYKFNFKGIQSVNGFTAYEYQVKPKQKRPGLFKGKVFLEATTGRILRVEGTLVKSPSVFVKKVEFEQDYEEVGGFSLPARMHSVAKTRLFGKAIVDISHSDYITVPISSPDSAQSLPVSSGPSNQ